METKSRSGSVPFVSSETIDEIHDGTGNRKFLARPLKPESGSGDAIITFKRGSTSPKSNPAAVSLNVKAKRILQLEERPAGPASKRPKLYSKIIEDHDSDEIDRDLLIDVGEILKELRTRNKFSKIPSAFTYFGQLIAHDLTFMKYDGDPSNPKNYHDQSLDYASVFNQGKIPDGEVFCHCGVCLGKTNKGQYEDIPRLLDGTPSLPDKRNDNNLATSQLTATLIRFHHVLAKLLGTSEFSKVYPHTAEHISNVVLNELLPHFVLPSVWKDVFERGPQKQRIIRTKPGVAFYIPTEFSAACFRFGHSLVRESYDWTPYLRLSSFDIRRASHLENQFNGTKLSSDWVVDWSGFLEPTGKNLTRHLAEAVDHYLTSDLANIPPNWVGKDHADLPMDGTTVNFPALTLLRGKSLRLPTGQALLRRLVEDCPECAEFAVENPNFPGDGSKMFEDLSKRLSKKKIEVLKENTPLWLYILCEADAGTEPGARLGPVGSRVVMETIHGAIESAGHLSVLEGKFQPHPVLGLVGRTFRFSDLVNIAKKHANVMFDGQTLE